MIKAFIELAYYNGHYDTVKKLYEYIQDSIEDGEEGYVINMPDILDYYGIDHFMRVFWSILSIKYGDYGTSPRTGFIEIDKIKVVLCEFEEAFDYFDEDEDE